MDADDLMMTDDQKAGLTTYDEVDHEQRQAQLLLEQEQTEADLAVAQVKAIDYCLEELGYLNLTLYLENLLNGVLLLGKSRIT